MKKRKNKKNHILLFLVFLTILLLISILIKINDTINESKNETKNKKENISNEVVIKNENLNTKLYSMNEKNRMQTYFGEFITFVENEDYDTAYKLLNNNFKSNYFSNVDVFKNYIIEKFPKYIGVNYKNIERQGELYVLTVELFNPLDTDFQTITQRVVIRENSVNDYTLSFQVQ